MSNFNNSEIHVTSFFSEATHCVHGQIVGADIENWRCDCVNGFNGSRCEEGTKVVFLVLTWYTFQGQHLDLYNI